MVRIGLILFGVVGILFSFVVSRSELTGNTKKLNRQLDRCLNVADYFGRSKVYSCQKTAQLGTLVSMSFAESFRSCIERMDIVFSINRDACHKKHLKHSRLRARTGN